MHDYSYGAHLVINDGYEDRLDMTITCQNAQQLLRAKDLIADQMNAYIAEFAVQSGLTGYRAMPSRMPLRFRQSFRSRPKRPSSRSRKNLPSRSRPKLHPMSRRKAPPRTMMHSMPSATARISHPSNLHPPKLPKRQRNPKEQKA